MYAHSLRPSSLGYRRQAVRAKRVGGKERTSGRGRKDSWRKTIVCYEADWKFDGACYACPSVFVEVHTVVVQSAGPPLQHQAQTGWRARAWPGSSRQPLEQAPLLRARPFAAASNMLVPSDRTPGGVGEGVGVVEQPAAVEGSRALTAVSSRRRPQSRASGRGWRLRPGTVRYAACCPPALPLPVAGGTQLIDVSLPASREMSWRRSRRPSRQSCADGSRTVDRAASRTRPLGGCRVLILSVQHLDLFLGPARPLAGRRSGRARSWRG